MLDSDNPALPLGAGGPTSGGPCQVGITLEPGEFCSVIILDVQAGDDLFEVRDGSGCYGSLCADDSMNLNGFLAYANRDGSWIITRVPDGSSSGEEAKTVPTPTLQSTTRAIPTPTPTPALPSAPAATPTLISTPTQTATAFPTPVDATTLTAPANVLYALEGSAIRVTWDAVDDADYYNIYHDDFLGSNCFIWEDGTPSFCEELATNVTETGYLHTAPALGSNYYWVVACNSGGCSAVETETPASPVVTKPDTPSNVTYIWEGSAIRVSWEPDSGADFYKVYHDDFFDSSCSLGRDGSPRFCDELAANVVASSYLHTDPDEDSNYYWVVACNRGGCSDVDSESPARSYGTSTKTAPLSTRNADRAILVALYNAMGGENWRIDRSWLSEKPIDRWYGVTADRSGHITGLDLDNNELSGEIPEELGGLSNLVELDLSLNQLSGEIPGELGNLSNLKLLDLTGNKMTGEIPAELGGLTSLEYLFLRSNQLTGSIPAELGSLSNLVHLRLNHNQLSGEIPAELGSLSNLKWLYLFGNQLSGGIPGALGNLTNLERLQLQGNQLSGKIPPELGHLTNLEVLALHSNQLSGEIPDSLGALSKLERMFLHENQLSGEIPPELGHLTNLEVLALHSNRLSGALPDSLAALTKLIAVTACEANQLSCDFAGMFEEGVAVGVEVVFGVGGVVGNTASAVGGVMGDVGGALGDVARALFGGWW